MYQLSHKIGPALYEEPPCVEGLRKVQHTGADPHPLSITENQHIPWD